MDPCNMCSAPHLCLTLMSLYSSYRWASMIVMFSIVLCASTAQTSLAQPGHVHVHEAYPCNKTLNVSALAIGLIRVPQVTPRAHYYCFFLIGTMAQGHRIRLTFGPTHTISDVTNTSDDVRGRVAADRTVRLKQTDTDNVDDTFSNVSNITEVKDSDSGGISGGNIAVTVDKRHDKEEYKATSRTRIRTTVGRLPCTHEYLHVGNSLYAIDIKSLTSYRFCDVRTRQEVVSRGKKLWVVYQTRGAATFAGMTMKYEVLPYVACRNNSYFRCSPVQCIKYHFLCDGHAQCSNGRDEYCDRILPSAETFAATSLPAVQGSNASNTGNFFSQESSLSDDPSCFLCEDGTCIRPTLPIYHFHRDEPWWWLCDMFPHCMDGTDERMDICLTIESKSSALYTCESHVPSLLRDNTRTPSPVLWKRLTCDSIRHCYGGEDEDIDLCAKPDGQSNLLNAKMYGPLVAVIIFTVTLTLIYNRENLSQRLRRHTHARRKSHPPRKQRELPEKLDSAPRSNPGGTTGNQFGPSVVVQAPDKVILGVDEKSEVTCNRPHPNYFILSQTSV